MSAMWAELRAAIQRLNDLFTSHRELRREIANLTQQLRDLRGGS